MDNYYNNNNMDNMNRNNRQPQKSNFAVAALTLGILAMIMSVCCTYLAIPFGITPISPRVDDLSHSTGALVAASLKTKSVFGSAPTFLA